MSKRRYEVVLENEDHKIEYIVAVMAYNVDDAFELAIERFQRFEGDEIKMTLKSCELQDFPHEKCDLTIAKRDRELAMERGE